jgi:hypothetical protein
MNTQSLAQAEASPLRFLQFRRGCIPSHHNSTRGGSLLWGLALLFASLALFPCPGAAAVIIARSGQPLPPPVLNPAPVPRPDTDALLFRNGDLLYGNLNQVNPATGIFWKRPDAPQPLEFNETAISDIYFQSRQPTNFHAVNPCLVRLTNEDEFEASLVSTDAEKVVLDTWYAGRITVPRKAVQLLIPRATNREPIFEGPHGLDDWTMGEVKSVSVVGEGGVWSYKDNAFFATRAASIARDLKLPDVASIQFDLAWKGLFYLAVALYADYLYPVNLGAREQEPPFGGFYSLQLNSYSAVLRPILQTNTLNALEQVSVPAFNQTNSARIEIRVSKPKRTIALMVNGNLVKRWIDTEFVGSGTAVRFVHQGQGSIRLSNIRVTEWDGQFEEKASATPDSPHDLAKLKNGDTVMGNLDSIEDGKLLFSLTDRKLEIPIQRAKQIEFAGTRAERLPRDQKSVKAFFYDGGSMTLKLESWTEQKVIAHSPALGRLAFDPLAFSRIQFSETQ